MGLIRLLVAAALALLAVRAQAAPIVAFDANGPGPTLINARGVARVVTAVGDHEVVEVVAADLRADLERVAGRSGDNGAEIWLGTLGRHPGIDRLVRRGLLDVSRLRGAWESFLIATVERPAPGRRATLVIVGSDRRGTAFGAYELSRAIGVSPWHWWADVPPPRHGHVRALTGTARFGPPSVKYRGLFINDEDWGLEPWAARTFEPENGTIGPKTYARLFELMLRLKANMVWPAMHKVTRPFNADRRNAELADRYAIVMGSSHAEPMLRNNVGEWTAGADAYDYSSNAEGVAKYWRERVRANARYENVWTLGMRGIHDSGMVGPSTDEDRRRLLERIFADQRAMLRAHVDSDVERVPQVFMPYKEVLDLYRGGLKVPDDVTIMWPDDNFGYIRRFPNEVERRRPGGSGVYYHLSYLGAPLSYLWLSTTPPALVREEMGRAYDHGAREMWVVNVGDLKPAELATDYFLRLAWDVEGTRRWTIDEVISHWSAETVGADAGTEVAGILAEHHRLNFIRRPEHLQWWLPGELSRPSPLPLPEVAERLAAFARLADRVRNLAPRIAPERRDAFFQLVEYPVLAAAHANVRLFEAEAHNRLRDLDPVAAHLHAVAAHEADAAIGVLTRRYNEEIANGKWRGLMAVEPADGQWPRYRLTPPILPVRVPAPPVAVPKSSSPAPPARAPVLLEAEAAVNPSTSWRVVDGLGRNGASVVSTGYARLAYHVDLPPGHWRAVAEILPTYPSVNGEPLRLLLAVDGAAPVQLVAARSTGNPAWSRAVLDNRIELPLTQPIAGGQHRLTVVLDGTDVILDRIRFEPLPM